MKKNEKRVNKIFLNTLGKDTLNFTNGDIVFLGEIAFQCPLAGGKSVSRARGMFLLIFPNALFGEDLCDGAGSSSRKKQTPDDQDLDAAELLEAKDRDSSTGEVSVFPNPAQDKLIIRYAAKTELTFALYNLNGKLIKQIHLDATKGEKLLDVAAIGNGLYIYRIFSKTDALYSGKITILR